MRHDGKLVYGLAFAPDGSWLASCDLSAITIWPLDGAVPPSGRILLKAGPTEFYMAAIAASPDGMHLVASVGVGDVPGEHKEKPGGGDLLLSLDGSTRRALTGIRGQTSAVAVSPDGRLAAGAGGMFDETENQIRVWDLESGDTFNVLEPELGYFKWSLQFSTDKHLLSSGPEGLRQWDVESGESELLYEGNVFSFSASVDGRRVLLVQREESEDTHYDRALYLDLTTGVVRALQSHGSVGRVVALDPTGTIAVTTDREGVIRAGPVTGEEPHLLLGHEAQVASFAFDPRTRWLASGADDGTARLWPMPDLSKPPLHTLPREELIAKLKTLTNLRVVPDEESPTGWKLTHDPFPGWETVPTW
jgi:WD40 repeat protein